jgi:mono/diheme cytochrome c family protein
MKKTHGLWKTSFFGCLLLTGGLLQVSAAEIDASKIPVPATRKVDFAKDILPMFNERCSDCHGEKKQKSGYRLDAKDIAYKGGESGKAAIVPGKSGESRLIHLVAGLEQDAIMPPKGEKLTAEQIGLLRAWIDQGADWPEAYSKVSPKEHWAYVPPVKPALPKVKNAKWPANEVDHFILARLEKEGLQPSTEADKIILLRRLYLDLLGLPPIPAQIDAFLADSSKNAWSKQVEQVLKSPHYGEKWGRHWLDAARYADSDGYEKDMSRDVWPYRDYVINALNRDLGYNQFVVDQIAGDLLPNHSQDQVVATGFLRNSMVNMEGAIDPEQFRMEAMFDRMEAIGKSVLGLTIQCAQCHNHKYDPFSQEEYYRLFAYINNDHEARPAVYTQEDLLKTSKLHKQMAELEGQLKKRDPDWAKKMEVWEKEAAENQPTWQVVWPLEHVGENDQRYYELKDQSLLAAGYAPTKMNATFRSTNQLSGITAFRLELLTDPNLPFGGPGRSFMGTCALTEFAVDVADAKNPTNKAKVKITSASTDYNQLERKLEMNFYDKSTNSRSTGPIKFAIDGNGNTAWGIDAGPGRRNVDRKAVFVAEKPVGYTNGTILSFYLKQNHGGWNSDDHMNNNLGRFRLSVTTNVGPITADPLPKKVRDILGIPKSKRSAEQLAAVFSYWRTTVPDWKDTNDKIEALWQQWPSPSSSLTLMAREEMRDTRVLKRGDWLKPTKPVTAGVPAILNPLPPDAPPTRLTFAKWLVDRKAPTTARVMVNRVWQAYFGNGLVDTPEDFGVRAPAPSHPELLDWLAVDFMDHGWSLKRLHRQIVLSATYRQSSKISPELYEKDQYNRLLARGPRFRVEAEAVRDIALAAAGLLNEKVGGRSVMPPAPAFLFQPPASYAPFPWKDEEGPEKYRRALYTFRRRSTPYPALQNFDAPNGDFACVRRVRSNTPLQALTTLNEPLFVEAAQALALKTLSEAGQTDLDRVTYIFRRCIGRQPSKAETQEILSLFEKQKERFAEGWLDPKEVGFIEAGKKPEFPKGTSPTQLAAWTIVSRVVLNLDETITKE